MNGSEDGSTNVWWRADELYLAPTYESERDRKKKCSANSRMRIELGC